MADQSTAAVPAQTEIVGNAVKIVGEMALVPGASQFLDGHILSGLGHAVAGMAASALVGPLGLLLVGINSYSNSVSGKHLYQQAMGD